MNFDGCGCAPFEGDALFGDRCRACLASSGAPRPLSFGTFAYCTSIEASADDGLPRVLCPECHDLLDRFYYFKQQCERSDAVLKRHVELPKVDRFEDGDANKTDFCILENRTDEPISTAENMREVEEESATNSKDCDMIVESNKNDVDTPHIEENVTEPRQESSELSDQKKKCKKSNKKNGTLLYCQKCDKSFYKYVKLEAHMRKHFGLKPDSTIGCGHCDKKFTTEKNLKSHLRVHTGERKYKCKTCGKDFAYLNVLKNHERAHAGIKKYVCHHCGKKFVQLTNLNTHLLQHTGEKPFVCEPCNRRFGQMSEYKLHMLRHSGVKNFACNLCPLRFYTNANLQKHMGVHSDARPYACKTCEKRFKTRSYMAVHNRTHTGERPFSCDYCPMKFMSGKDRRNHHKTHTGEKTPPKSRKSKAHNRVPNGRTIAEVIPDDAQPLRLHDQHMDIDIMNRTVDNVTVDDPYIPQQSMHSLSSAMKLLPKQNSPYDPLKPIEKQSPNSFFRISPATKNQCTYLNPMY